MPPGVGVGQRCRLECAVRTALLMTVTGVRFPMTRSLGRLNDRVTLVGIAIVAYALANMLHECLGHGATCVAVGARLELLSAVGVECDTEGRGQVARSLVLAGGTLANLLAGAT